MEKPRNIRTIDGFMLQLEQGCDITYVRLLSLEFRVWGLGLSCNCIDFHIGCQLSLSSYDKSFE